MARRKRIAGKRTGDNSPVEKRTGLDGKQRRLPLDDPRWLPLIETVKLRFRETVYFATLDVLEKLKRDEVRSMRRNMTNPSEREPLTGLFWQDVEIDWTMIDWGMIHFRYRAPGPGTEETRFDGRSFYVWRPDLEKCWPPSSVKEEQPPRIPVEPKGFWQVARVKEIISVVFPNGVPTDSTAKDVLRDITDGFKERGWKLPSLDTIARARGRRRR